MENNSNEIDFLALLAEVHGSAPEDLREGHIAEAINALEGAHRQAALALRELNTAGLRRKRLQQSAQKPQTAAARPVEESRPSSNAEATIAVQSGEGASINLDHRTLTHIVRPNRGRR